MRRRHARAICLVLPVRAASSGSVLAGGGATLSRTTLTSVGIFRGTGNPQGGDLPFSFERSADETRFALTAGADFPIHVAGRFHLVPTARIHYVFRADSTNDFDNFSTPPPGKVALRAGIGGMFAF